MGVGELHRPVAAVRGAERGDARPVEIVLPVEPVEDRRPLAFRIAARTHRRLADPGHVDEQHREPEVEEVRRAASHLLLPRVDAAPRHYDRRALDSTRSLHVEVELAALAVAAVEGTVTVSSGGSSSAPAFWK